MLTVLSNTHNTKLYLMLAAVIAHVVILSLVVVPTIAAPIPKQTLQLVQSSFANVNLMNARLGFAWAVVVVMGR